MLCSDTNEKMRSVSFSLPEDDCRRLDELARDSCRSRAGYLRRLIRAYLEYIKQHPEQRME